MPPRPPASAEAPFRFAIAATFTAEPLEPVLRFWSRRLKAECEVAFAPYNQVHQTLLDPSSVFGRNAHGLNVILLRFEDLGREYEANALQLAERLRAASAELPSPSLLVLCPPAHPGDEPQQRLARRIAVLLDSAPAVACLNWEEMDRRYPVTAPHDPEGEKLGRIPYTETWFAALGTAIVRHAHALSMRPYKVIVLDCDNTLWRGICGEDGPAGVELDAPRRALQQFMSEQRDAGMLLAMASKNNEQDVQDTFAAHPEMPLQLRHFVAWRINWDSKAENLASLAAELNLGVDSFIFVDDNPRECAEVAERLPEALALTLPENISDTPRFLDHVWAFDHAAVTEEDRHRSASYSQQAEFGRQARSAQNLEDFLRSLDLKVRVEPMSAARDLGRVAQLTQRTNQFNTTTIRRTEAETAALAREEGVVCWTVHVADRFGDYGLTGVAISRPRGDALAVDTLLLSCRVLGRGVEHRVLEHLAGQARAAGLEFVEVPLVPTARNAPARHFLEAAGSEYRKQTAAGLLFRFPVSALEGLGARAGQLAAAREESAARPAPPAPKSTPAASSRRFVEYAAIARALASPEAVVEAIRRESLAAHEPLAGLNDIERQVAAIWAELLRRPNIGRDDNFFDLGGHSLLAVLLLLRIREAFGVEITIDAVYSGSMTLAGLAARIETEQLGKLHPDEYAALVAEIDGLTDDEVREILAREEAGAGPAA